MFVDNVAVYLLLYTRRRFVCDILDNKFVVCVKLVIVNGEFAVYDFIRNVFAV